MAIKTKDLTFETALAQLEAIVQKLENGEVPLEESMQHFQDGIELSNFCNQRLQNAEETMTKLMAENNELEIFADDELAVAPTEEG